MSLKENSNIIPLHRGGFLVKTPGGNVQVGSPPETIKDTMIKEEGVPQIFILPHRFFSWIKGISVAEVEFPIYYNFFLKQKKTTIVCTEEQASRFLKTLSESLFGPEDLNIRKDFPLNTPKEQIPDLRSELNFFRNNLQLENLVEFKYIKEGMAEINGIQIKINSANNFLISYAGEDIAEIPGEIEYIPTYDIGKRLPEPFDPPLFGMTCLGPSHGFDPNDNTSGFILWLNRRGIMIDPPVNSTEWLVDSNVNPKLIDSVILTHCHADHDAGTLQKILEEGKITVYSTKTIMDSFLIKYANLTNTSEEYLSKLFDYIPLKIGHPFFIHGGRFEFFYSLHSIPTIGFMAEFMGESICYSSDHNNDPEIHEKLINDNIISELRYKELRSFPWEASLVYHESGIAPLHTPITFLNSLSKEQKKKIVVYHIAKKAFPEETDLRLAQFGIEHTQILDIEEPKYEDAYHLLGVLNYLDFFENLPLLKAQEFVTIVEEKKYKKGDLIIRKGDPGDNFFIIKSGNISVVSDKALEHRKIYGTYDYFGEVALITGQKRTADIEAITDVTALTIGKDEFLHFISGTPFEKTLMRLSLVRDSESWNILSQSPVLRILTSTQKTVLESMLNKFSTDDSTDLIVEGDPLQQTYIVRKGIVEVFKKGKKITELKKGDFLGAMVKIYRNEPAEYTFRSKGKVSLYYVEKDDVMRFLDQNPGLTMKLVYDFQDDIPLDCID